MNVYSFYARGFAARLGHDFSIGTEQPVTYADLARDSARAATWFVAQGVNAGDRVLANVAPTSTAIAAYLGCLRAGAVWVPLAPNADASTLERLTALAEPRLTFGAVELKSLAGTLADLPDRFETARVADEAPAVIVWTSTARAVVLSHWHLMQDARTTISTYRLTDTDGIVHRAALDDRLSLSLLLGGALAVGARFGVIASDSARTLQRAAKNATILAAPSGEYARLLDEAQPTPEKLKHLRLCLAIGEPVAQEVFENWASRAGAAPVQLRATAEAGLLATSPLDGERRAGSFGLPPAGVQLRIVNRAGKTAKAGSAGALEAKSPSSFHIYWRAPDALASIASTDGYLKTGLIGVLSEDGYLSLVDAPAAEEVATT